MRALIKLMLVLAIGFAMTFLIMKVTGILSVEKIELWLTLARESNSMYVAVIVVVLLFLDLFVAMPTLTIIMLSGYFLGHTYGAISSIIGVSLAGITGYLISYFWGRKLVGIIIKGKSQQVELGSQFNQYGTFMIIFSRAMPILPEVSACMSGIVKMPFIKFISAWLISAVPYITIATYAGSVSTLDNPKPAIVTAIILTTIMWSAWFVLKRINQKKTLYSAR